MSEHNPYESPTSQEQAVDPHAKSGARFGWFLVLAIAATAGSIAAPFLAVPLTFLLAPAFARAFQLWRLRLYDGETHNGRDIAMMVVTSLGYAVPSALASVIAFGCVCFPGAFVGGFVIGNGTSGNPPYGLMIIGGGLLIMLSTFCGLWLGDNVLRRYRFFIDRHNRSGSGSTNIESSVNQQESD